MSITEMRQILAIVGKYSVFRIGYVCADGEHFRALIGMGISA